MIRKAVFPVAGLGSRFLPVTKSVPKELLPVLNKPLVQYAVEEAFAAGVQEILFVNGRGKGAIEDYFDHAFEIEATLAARGKVEEAIALEKVVVDGGRCAFVRQSKPKGLGHAVLCARQWIGDEPFAVLLPDDLTLAAMPVLQQMVEAYMLTHGNMVAVEEVPYTQTHQYGIIAPKEGEGDRIIPADSIVEKPNPADAPSRLAVIGRYILHPKIFDVLSHQAPGIGGEIQLTDALAQMIPAYGLNGFKFTGQRFDCGSVEGMVAAQVAFGLGDTSLRPKILPLLQRVLMNFNGGAA